MHMILIPIKFSELRLEVLTHIGEDIFHTVKDAPAEYTAPVLSNKHQMRTPPTTYLLLNQWAELVKTHVSRISWHAPGIFLKKAI